MKQVLSPKILFLPVVVVGGLFLAVNSLYTVKSGFRGIVFTFGKIDAVVTEGLHVKIPFIQNLEFADVRTMKATAPCAAASKDLQTVSAEVSLNYHLDPSKLKELYTKVGMQVEQKVIDPRIQEVVKATMAKFSAEELLTKREMVKSEIARAMSASAAKYHVIVEDIQITNFKFSESFEAAIEAKQTAEQQALKAENDLKRIEVEARQRITQAEAEARAIQIQALAIREQGGAEYVNLKAIEKWNGVLPTMTGGGAVPFINIK